MNFLRLMTRLFRPKRVATLPPLRAFCLKQTTSKTNKQKVKQQKTETMKYKVLREMVKFRNFAKKCGESEKFERRLMRVANTLSALFVIDVALLILGEVL